MNKSVKLNPEDKEFLRAIVEETQIAMNEMYIKREDERHVGMMVFLENMRDEFRVYGDQIKTLESIVDTGFERVDKRFDNVESRLDSLESDVHDLKSDMHDLKGDVGQIKTYIFNNVEPRIHVLEFREKVS